MSDIFWPSQGQPDGNVGRLVHYTGDVQGVGFRATATSIARRYQVTGWVKNLPDGRVGMLVEGTEAEVSRFLDAIRTYWGEAIQNTQIEQREPTGKYTGFTVAR